MKIDGQQIIIETIDDAEIAADAGEVVAAEFSLTSVYRDLTTSKIELPMVMGKWASKDVIEGLRRVSTSDIAHGCLDASTAKVYLGSLGLESSS